MEHGIRHVDRVEADVECLMCGRLIGQLFGLAWREAGGGRAARSVSNLTTVREVTPGAPLRRVRPLERFRCGQCGGFGIIGEVLVSVVANRSADGMCPVHGERKSGPGRPPKGCRCRPERAAA